MSLWFGQVAPRGQGCDFVCPGSASSHCESNHAAQLLNQRAEKLVGVPEQRSWGWSPVYAHTRTQICLFLSPRFVDPLVFLRDKSTGRADFLLTNVLIFPPYPQVLQAPWTPLSSLLLYICLEHKCQNKHARYRGISQTITEPILADDLCLWSNVCGKQRYTSHF